MDGDPKESISMPTRAEPDADMIVRQESVALMREYDDLLRAQLHAKKMKDQWAAEARRIGVAIHTHRMKAAAWVEKHGQ